MGVPYSTLVSYTVLSALGFFFYRNWSNKRNPRQNSRPALQKHREEDRQNVPAKKENKKKHRVEAPAAGNQEAKPKPQAKSQPAAWQTAAATNESSDDGVDNREFARQLSSVKEGTKFASKSKDEKRQKSVKQSRAQEKDDSAVDVGKVSAPSSTAGIDADDDQSSTTSPIVKAADVSGVSDMLEKPGPGPTVLRLTDVDDKPKQKKKAKSPEPVETKKQRQNRRKVEEAKAMREQAEKERKVKMEAQRRLAREAEGRPAKDGSAFVASQAKPSVWTANGVNGTSQSQSQTQSQASSSADGFIPVQPLDTFESNVQTDASKSSAPSAEKSESWMSSLPSEEEQMEMLREEEAWSTVKTKSRKGKKKDVTSDSNDEPSSVAKAAPLTPVTNQPAKTQAPAANGRPTKTFSKQSSFAALITDEEPEEEEWDV
ncbi:hypothetical protein NKR23_g774 [Pleurostoma richardsiae]|jgi:hypothetical protein|uniref:Uncharacterized protein n=1 Tax=Pleurostoma richardsiae TaxID=41990 RepID=A0AA38VXF2_9PEZI|nr:hypothetical protein NKR23_g774 [Pleurostoma richardsiae]